jgi:hypothetical protein
MPDWALTSTVAQRNGEKIIIRLHINNRSDYAYFYQVQGRPDTKNPDYIKIATNWKPAFFRRIYASNTHKSGLGCSRLYNHIKDRTWGYFQPFPEDDTQWISYTYVEASYHSLLCDKGWRSPSPGGLDATRLDNDVYALRLQNNPQVPRHWNRNPNNTTRAEAQQQQKDSAPASSSASTGSASSNPPHKEIQPTKATTPPSSPGKATTPPSSPIKATTPPASPTRPPSSDEEDYNGFPSKHLRHPRTRSDSLSHHWLPSMRGSFISISKLILPFPYYFNLF